VVATRELVAAVWPAFTSGPAISRQAFLQPGDGLADTIIASLDLGSRDTGGGQAEERPVRFVY